MFNNITPGLKNLLILMGLFYVLQMALEQRFGNYWMLAAFYPDSSFFRPWQLLTHMFSHGSFMHLLFNGIALFTFGMVMERKLRTKRFLILFFVSGLGALLLHFISVGFMVYQKTGSLFPLHEGLLVNTGPTVDFLLGYFPVVGASGALYGVLISFLLYYPNEELIFLFIPYPIKAKYLIPIILIIDIVMAIGQFSWDPIAHFAHLGGAITGYFLVRYWSWNRVKNRWS
ncbi:MAG: rhomboid family intramembrane serine protease [Bacteroidetes bacterium]|nr:rhomboid family intramembrane serine protease [Bacteroidota bacterium]